MSHSKTEMIRAYLTSGTPVIELNRCLGNIAKLIRKQIGPAAPHIVVEASLRLARLYKLSADIGAAEGTT